MQLNFSNYKNILLAALCFTTTMQAATWQPVCTSIGAPNTWKKIQTITTTNGTWSAVKMKGSGYVCPPGSTLVNGNQCQAPAIQPPSIPATVTTVYPLCASGTTKGYGIYGGSWTVCRSPGCPAGFYNVGTDPFGICETTNIYFYGGSYTTAPTGFIFRSYGGWSDINPYGNAAIIYEVIGESSYKCPATYTLSGTTCLPPTSLPPLTPATPTCN
jgi:hypothetical protein